MSSQKKIRKKLEKNNQTHNDVDDSKENNTVYTSQKYRGHLRKDFLVCTKNKTISHYIDFKTCV